MRSFTAKSFRGVGRTSTSIWVGMVACCTYFYKINLLILLSNYSLLIFFQYVEDNLSVMSIGFLLSSPDDAIIWRGPKKNGMIRQFLSEVDWGNLDYLLMDTPPGTSDEHLSASTYLSKADLTGAIIVTTPQEVALLDVRKEIDFCRKVNIKVLGVVENMSLFVCPCCKSQSEIFPANTGGAKKMCLDMDVPYLGNLPLDPKLARCCDEGKDFISELPDSPAVQASSSIVNSEYIYVLINSFILFDQ